MLVPDLFIITFLFPVRCVRKMNGATAVSFYHIYFSHQAVVRRWLSEHEACQFGACKHVVAVFPLAFDVIAFVTPRTPATERNSFRQQTNYDCVRVANLALEKARWKYLSRAGIRGRRQTFLGQSRPSSSQR